jgi:hypothetical protein
VFELSSDVLIFVLRLALLAALYLFLALVLLTAGRELRQVGGADAAPRAQRARLVVLDAGRTSLVAGDSLALGPVTTIGRSGQSAIVLDDTFVSSEHAIIGFRGGRWWLKDLSSTNGTLLNDRPVQGEVGLTSGDVVSIGDIDFKVML